MKKSFASTKSILLKNDFLERLTAKNKYVKTEHQDYGIRLATRLCDRGHKALYIKLAKELPRNIIETAAQFAIDYPVKGQDGNKGRIFMWKLKGVCIEKGVKIPAVKKKLNKKQQLKKIQNKMF